MSAKIDKLEEKIDRVKEDVSELKTDFKVHAKSMEEKMKVFDDHMGGDKKIISSLEPVLAKLPTIVEIAEQYQFEKKKKEENKEKLKKYSLKIALLSAIVGIGAGITKILSYFR